MSMDRSRLDHDPIDDEDYRAPHCETPGCEGRITFPDREAFCSECLIEKRRDRIARIEAAVPDQQRRAG